MFEQELKTFNSQSVLENLHQSFQYYFDQNNDINLNDFADFELNCWSWMMRLDAGSTVSPPPFEEDLQ